MKYFTAQIPPAHRPALIRSGSCQSKLTPGNCSLKPDGTLRLWLRWSSSSPGPGLRGGEEPRRSFCQPQQEERWKRRMNVQLLDAGRATLMEPQTGSCQEPQGSGVRGQGAGEGPQLYPLLGSNRPGPADPHRYSRRSHPADSDLTGSSCYFNMILGI